MLAPTTEANSALPKFGADACPQAGYEVIIHRACTVIVLFRPKTEKKHPDDRTDGRAKGEFENHVVPGFPPALGDDSREEYGDGGGEDVPIGYKNYTRRKEEPIGRMSRDEAP